AGRVGLGREAGLADVPGLGDLKGEAKTFARRGLFLRPPFNAQLRTGTD
ncbi:hypothetical protein WN51_08734, partial [Melipona quadrifasciata]